MALSVQRPVRGLLWPLPSAQRALAVCTQQAQYVMPRAALASQICCAPALRHAESVPRQEEDDIRWMRLALQQAQTAFDADEVPIGAIIVCNGELISSGQNMTERKRNPLCHAELQCILAAAEQLQAWRLQDATLYCTIEPCPMCAGAMLQARLQRLVYGGRQPRLGADGSWVALFPQQNCTCLQGPRANSTHNIEEAESEQAGRLGLLNDAAGGALQASSDACQQQPCIQPVGPHPFHPNISVTRGVLEDECKQLMVDFFARRRAQQKGKPE